MLILKNRFEPNPQDIKIRHKIYIFYSELNPITQRGTKKQTQDSTSNQQQTEQEKLEVMKTSILLQMKIQKCQ